ncbi:MAG: hypothetical protein QXH67_03490 [Candidatus Bathyarchaeia archaeon]
MERRFILLLALFGCLSAASLLTVAAPLSGLSTILGVSVLGSSVLGSSVLGSSVLGSSVLGSSVLASTIVEAYAQAVVSLQPWLSSVLIGLLVYLELTDPSVGGLRSALLELRRSWLPFSALLTVLFSIIVAMRVWSILVG